MRKQPTGTVLRIGDGRGFVVDAEGDRMILTAAHCLHETLLVGAHSGSEDRLFRNLIGALGSEPDVCCQCYFLDPIADIAVLGEPDNQMFFQEAEDYNNLLESMKAFTVGKSRAKLGDELTRKGLVMSLKNEWVDCTLKRFGHGALWVTSTPIIRGMSGSPILLENGAAVGVITTGSETPDSEHGPNAVLRENLPGWMLRKLTQSA